MSHLLEPAWLLLAPFAILWRRGARGSILFAPAPLIHEPLPISWRVRLRHLPRLLESAGLLLLLLALARPVERVALPQVREGLDILLCLDTSSSMLATDLDARRTRLDLAKEAAARFLEGRPDDRVGLLSFARFPDLLCPPTLDHRALARLLGTIEQVQGDGPEDATGLGSALARAAEVLEAGAAKSRLIILLTDGEENVALEGKQGEIAPVHAAQLCRRLGVRVYAIAAGLGQRDRDGNWKAIDTAAMREAATRTGGRFFEARDAGAIAQVYAAIGELERAPFLEERFIEEERFLVLLASALALLLCGRLLAATALMVLP